MTPVSSDQHRVAVLATTAQNDLLCLQLLSVSSSGKPVVMGTHLMNVNTESATAPVTSESSKWRCCCSKFGEVLLFSGNEQAFIWSLTPGMYAAIQSK